MQSRCSSGPCTQASAGADHFVGAILTTDGGRTGCSVLEGSWGGRVLALTGASVAGMRSAEHDRVWWSRVLLAVLSFGFTIAAGAGLLAAGMAIDPEDEVPRVWVIAPGVVALVGFIGAGLGGLAARIGSALLGLGTAAGCFWFLAESHSDGLPNTPAIIQFYLNRPGVSGDSVR